MDMKTGESVQGKGGRTSSWLVLAVALAYTLTSFSTGCGADVECAVMLERVIICRCEHAGVLDSADVASLTSSLLESGVEVLEFDDLCGAAASRDRRLRAWVSEGATVVACHARVVRWMLSGSGVASGDGVRCIDLRGGDIEGARAACGVGAPKMTVPTVCAGPKSLPDWAPWYPVIDYDRCTGCRQCLSFCPFGVYSEAKGQVRVSVPQNCKNNCPACARLCPQVAIMFPKLPDAPLNGDTVQQVDIDRVQRALTEQDGDEGLHEILARRKLRAAYRKLERNAEASGREPSQEELEHAVARHLDGGADE
jgi:NAD-dependent dihydropyrimidine dehydrogenase PreA subunit